jgi:hypothetical protein
MVGVLNFSLIECVSFSLIIMQVYLYLLKSDTGNKCDGKGLMLLIIRGIFTRLEYT